MPRGPMPTAPQLPTLLITRPLERAQRFADQCEAAFGQPIPTLIAPVVRIVPLPPPDDLSGHDAVIFTSEAGVAAVADLPGPRVAWAVGPRTAAAARAAGFSVRSGGGTAEYLIKRLRQARPGGALIHLRGAESRGNLAPRLQEAGLSVAEAVVYRQEDCDISEAGRAALAGRRALVLPVFSAKSAQRLLAHDIAAPHTVVAISPAVADVWARKKTANVHLAGSATAEAMAEVVAAAYIRATHQSRNAAPGGGDR